MLIISLTSVDINYSLVMAVPALTTPDTLSNTLLINMPDKGSKNMLYVSFVNNTAAPYAILPNAQSSYALNQSYSWVRDETSRYSLVSYSIDNGNFIPVSRLARGNFTLDIPAENAHSIVFLATAQYPIDINSSTGFTISPPSPTGDNWFDSGSNVTIATPYTLQTDQGKIRQQLIGISIDQSDSKLIPRVDSGTFNVEVLMSSPHNLNFTSVTQYYLNGVSQYGTITGIGWYDAGSMAILTVNAPDELLVRPLLTGWEGTNIKSSGNTASILVDSYKTVVAKWTTDYSQAMLLGIIPPIVAASIFLIRYKRNKPTIDLPVKLQTTDDNYSKEIIDYVLQKSIENLDSMRTSGIISDNRYSQLKEKLKLN